MAYAHLLSLLFCFLVNFFLKDVLLHISFSISLMTCVFLFDRPMLFYLAEEKVKINEIAVFIFMIYFVEMKR